MCRPWGVAVVKMPSQLLMNYQNNPSLANDQTIADLQLTIETASLQQTSTSPTSLKTASPQTNSSTSDQHYLIGIADRSNNRIQLLDYNSKTQQINVINVFGSGPGNIFILFFKRAKSKEQIYFFYSKKLGTRPGMFDRPAGICINLALGHIIVADKDNHRIQVFSLTGRYLFKFGEKGNRIG